MMSPAQMIEDILSLSDEEILAEAIEDGEDPAEIAAEGRRLFEAALAKIAAPPTEPQDVQRKSNTDEIT
jgi:hypothetical protein